MTGLCQARERAKALTLIEAAKIAPCYSSKLALLHPQHWALAATSCFASWLKPSSLAVSQHRFGRWITEGRTNSETSPDAEPTNTYPGAATSTWTPDCCFASGRTQKSCESNKVDRGPIIYFHSASRETCGQWNQVKEIETCKTTLRMLERAT